MKIKAIAPWFGGKRTMASAYQPQFPGWRERLIQTSIETLRTYNPGVWMRSRGQWIDPYYGCFSGGKDSVVIKELVRLAGVHVEWHYHPTTIDPPELTRFIREHHPDVNWDRPTYGFFEGVRRRGLPTRTARWCCSEFKESRNPKGRRLILGVRAAESRRRATNWQTFTFHRKAREYAVLPILHWHDDDVWAFIRERELPYCELYDEDDISRIGCVGCPLSRGSRKRDFARWPKFGRAWKKAARVYWDRRAGTLRKDGREWFGSALFNSFEEWWEWWISDDPLSDHGRPRGDDCQGVLELWN